MSGERKLKCAKCGAELVKQQYTFAYMNRTFGYDASSRIRLSSP